MADHRAEQVLVAFTAKLTGLATTDTNVERGRVYPNEASKLPALSIFMGPDEPPEPGDEGDNFPFIDSVLEVIVRAHVQASSGVLDTMLNLIRKEITVAIMADRKLGLTFVINTWQGVADEPDFSGEGNKRTATYDMHWFVKYRSSYNDPSA